MAERLVQERGFNGFSYADIASELQVTKPALHYHFPTKVDLGTALIGRYSQRFAHALAGLDASEAEPPTRISPFGKPATVNRSVRLSVPIFRTHWVVPSGANFAT